MTIRMICQTKKNFVVIFKGIESHSSLINDGVNSIEYAANFINFLQRVQEDLKKKEYLDNFLKKGFWEILLAKSPPRAGQPSETY